MPLMDSQKGKGSGPAAETLAEELTARELRKWCSDRGVTRRRGASKLETAQAAVEQAPRAVLEELGGDPAEAVTFPVVGETEWDAVRQMLDDEAADRGENGWVVLTHGADATNDKVSYLHVGFF